MADTAAIFLVVLFSLRNQERPPDSPEIGPFRIRPFQPPAKTSEISTPARRRRTSRL